MIPIIAAFQFLTIFPTVIKRMFTAQEMGRAVAWFPLVGVALGFALYGLSYSARLVFSSSVSAALTLCAWIAFTRFFHLDGFMDALDGLFGGWNPERRLEIMKDSRMGAFGTIGGILILLTKYAALSSTGSLFPSIMLAATLGRWASPLVIYWFPYAREDGLGMEMKRNVGLREVVTATLIAGATSWLVVGWLGLVFMAGAATIAFLVALYALRLIRGLTGDIYGTVTTLVEAALLVTFSAIHPL